MVAGVGMNGVTAVVEHLDLRQEETSHWQQGVCPGQSPRMFHKVNSTNFVGLDKLNICIAFGLDIQR